MKRHIRATLIVAVLLSATTFASMVHQDWLDQPMVGRQAIIDFLVDLVNPVPVPDTETIIDESSFADPEGKSNYVAKFYGWLTVPETGTYQFHYACDDYGMLYVSQDEEMANAVEVAYVDGWCAIAEWNKYPDTQHSEPMQLVKGQVMAVMAFFEEQGGGDNMDIGWTGPGLSNDITNPSYLGDHITHIPPVPTIAKSPNPEDGAVDVPRDTAMSWKAGKFAATHDVYLGTVYEDINDASRTDPRGVLVSQGQSDTTFVPPAVLEFGQTYYWRIDEVNAVPTTIFKGKIWSFTVEPFAYPVENIIATSNGVSEPENGPEKTIDGSGLNAEGQHSIFSTDMWLATPPGADLLYIQYEFDQVYKLDEMRVWNYNEQFEAFLGYGAKAVTVEYSVNGSDWTVLSEIEFAQGAAAPTYEANTSVDFGGIPVKFVRLTISSNYGGLFPSIGLSEVQFMYVPAHAREPQPADGSTGVPVGTALDWRAGREAVTHEVYISASEDAVVDGSSLVDTVATASYAGADLEFGMDYFWKIVEVNEADAITKWESPVWRFQTEEYAVIDDMESYDDEDNRIFDAWLDGFVNETGSTVGYFEAPFAEKTVVNSGSQSMPLGYDNSVAPFYSEAQLEVGTLNLSSNGADSLRLYVAGLAPAFLEKADGTILMNAIGTDIWDVADECRYAYKQLTGDGSMVARVDALDGSPSTWAKAGVMIRQTAAVGSPHSFMCMTGGDGNGASWQGRPDENAASVNNDATSAVAPPYWVRIDRNGDTLTGYLSPDGQDWTQLGDARSIPMSDPVLIGLALTSHNAAQATSAQFSNVSFTGSVSGDWRIAEIGAAQLAGNIPGPVYVALEDSSGGVAVVTHPDENVGAWSTWTEWTIPYTDLASVNLSRIAIVYVGVGDRDNPAAGGTGTIFVDDVGYGRPSVASGDSTTP